MAEQKQGHTPGPWKAVKGYNTAKIWDVYRQGSLEGTSIGTRICRLEENGGDLYADACLMAAAPELLAVLRAVMVDCGYNLDAPVEPTYSTNYGRAMLAIAKAEGRA